MAGAFSRTFRIGDQLQKELAHLIQFEVKDPRLGLVTINEVRVVKDLRYADIYYTLLNIDDHPGLLTENQAVLEKARGFLRRRLSQELRLGIIPYLRFHYDCSGFNGNHISVLIDKAICKDQLREISG